jgi:hypothetical protein
MNYSKSQFHQVMQTLYKGVSEYDNLSIKYENKGKFQISATRPANKCFNN